AARRARPDAAGRSSGCSCGSPAAPRPGCWRSLRWTGPRGHAERRSLRVPRAPCNLLVDRGGIARIVADHARHGDARLDRGDRLVDHALLLRVVADLDVADQREVLAERMADEAVVGQDPAQVRVAPEDDAEQVERLALEP